MLLWPFHALFGAIHRRAESRDPHWPSLERRFRAAFPTCAACGGKRLLQVHHVIPVHVDRSLELVWENLISLCMGLKLCHLRIGHLGAWRRWNEHARADAARALSATSAGG